MTDFTVVDMKAYRHLFATNLFVSNAGVVRIKDKSDTQKALAELYVIHKSRHHRSVDGVEALDN